MLEKLKIGLMDSIIGSFIFRVGCHRLEIGQVHVQVFNSLLIIGEGLSRIKFLLNPSTNAVWSIFKTKWIVYIVIIVVIMVLLAPTCLTLLQLVLETLDLRFHGWNFDCIYMCIQL